MFPLVKFKTLLFAEEKCFPQKNSYVALVSKLAHYMLYVKF